MFTIISFNLTIDNCTNFLRGVAIYKGTIRSSYRVGNEKLLLDSRTLGHCSSSYLVEFPNESALQFFKDRYTKFRYEDKENPVAN